MLKVMSSTNHLRSECVCVCVLCNWLWGEWECTYVLFLQRWLWFADFQREAAVTGWPCAHHPDPAGSTIKASAPLDWPGPSSIMKMNVRRLHLWVAWGGWGYLEVIITLKITWGDNPALYNNHKLNFDLLQSPILVDLWDRNMLSLTVNKIEGIEDAHSYYPWWSHFNKTTQSWTSLYRYYLFLWKYFLGEFSG